MPVEQGLPLLLEYLSRRSHHKFVAQFSQRSGKDRLLEKGIDAGQLTTGGSGIGIR